MKTTVLALVGLLVAISSQAQIVETHSSGTVNLAIPDNSAAGVTSTLTLTTTPGPFQTAITDIDDVNVILNISALGSFPDGWVGDLYVTLTHSSGVSVLLNRVGRGSGSTEPFVDENGYSENNLQITLDDQQVATRDVHRYRVVETGSHNTPIAAPGTLTGSWQPDGRTATAGGFGDGSDGDATRPALLSVFNDLGAAGAWALFLNDGAVDDLHRLDSWGLEITGVPEPSTYALVFGVVCIGAAIFVRRNRSQPATGVRG
jgi:subtilisin-like proprotein convertase family protein